MVQFLRLEKNAQIVPFGLVELSAQGWEQVSPQYASTEGHCQGGEQDHFNLDLERVARVSDSVRAPPCLRS